MIITKNHIYIFFIFLLYVSNAQTPALDSLKLALKNARHDTTKCNLLARLAATASDEEWPAFNQQLKTLAEKNIANNSEPKAVYLKHLATVFNNTGYIYHSQDNIPMALDQYNKSLKLREEIRDKKGIASTLNNIGLIYEDQGNNPKALDCYHKSLKIQEEIGDKQGIAGSLNNIGAIYFSQGDINNAKESFYKSLVIREEIGDNYGVAVSLSNIGSIYHSKGDFDEALKYYQKSLIIQEGIGDKIRIAESLGNIAAVFGEQGHLSSALEYYHKSLKLIEELGNKSREALYLNNIGAIYNKQGNTNKALLFANKGMQVAKETGYPGDIEKAAYTLKAIFMKQNKHKEALEMYELEIKMRDSLRNEETQRATVKKQTQYEYETKARELKNEQDKKDIQTAKEKEKQKVITYSVSAGLILVLILTLFVFRGYRQKQKTNLIITQQKIEVEKQKHLIEEKHKEITDSINYAERIQRSFLATKELLDENLTEYFIFFKPKDVVSGDFYWASQLNNGNFAFATADSTGHGVPGAIMSLLNISSLEKASETEVSPDKILNHTRKIIIERLKKDGSVDGGKDGMDCSLISLNKEKTKLEVAAANNAVWIIRGKEVIEIKADKMPVGKHDKQDHSFTLNEIDLQKRDVIYSLTDGFPDQFGGDKGKKFMAKKLKELLQDISQKPLAEQKEILEKTFIDWLGSIEQVDDVTLVGIRV